MPRSDQWQRPELERVGWCVEHQELERTGKLRRTGEHAVRRLAERLARHQTGSPKPVEQPELGSAER